jgi:hypothetical protein
MNEEIQKTKSNQLEVVSLDKTELLKNLQTVKKSKNQVEITADYLALENGEEMFGYFIGNSLMTPLNGENEKQPAVKILAEDGKTYISGSAVLVGSLQDLPIPTPIKIVKTGKKVGKNKFSYDTFEVYLLG